MADSVLKFKQKLDLQNSAIQKLTVALAKSKGKALAILCVCFSLLGHAQHIDMTWVGGDTIGNQGGTWGTKNELPDLATPGGLLGAAQCKDKDGNVWVFGGVGRDSKGNYGYLNDLWKWDGDSWTYIAGNDEADINTKTTQPYPTDIWPGGRKDAACFADSKGDFWVYGGYGIDYGSGQYSLPGVLGDLWKFDGEKWIDVHGPYWKNTQAWHGQIPNPGCRRKANLWIDKADKIWIFGGHGYGDQNVKGDLNDMWTFNGGKWHFMDGSKGQDDTTAVYGTIGVADTANQPHSRNSAVNWVDDAGGVWLYGGVSSINGADYFSDLWKWKDTAWTWMGGSKLLNRKGVYGTKGVSDTANHPGARSNCGLDQDDQGNVFIFGGAGYGASTDGVMNDIWKWDGNTWTWINGSKAVNPTANFGTYRVASSTVKTKPSIDASFWVGKDGNFHLFGGVSFGSPQNAYFDSLPPYTKSAYGYRYNTLWKYNGTDWAWIHGAKSVNASSVLIPVQEILARTPSSRYGAASWALGEKKWLFGGYGLDVNGDEGYLQDLWEWDGKYWTWIDGSNLKNDSGDYYTPFARHPASRANATTWVKGNKLYMFGGYGQRSIQGYLQDGWYWEPSNREWNKFIRGNPDHGFINGSTDDIRAMYRVPGSRERALKWKDSKGNLWFFGGKGYGYNGAFGQLCDLWRFDDYLRSYRQVKGSYLPGQSGNYGTLGVGASTNHPGGRNGGATWVDHKDNLWLFGGQGLDENGDFGYLNDLWKWDGTHWVWMGGPKTRSASGNYGAMNLAATSNWPGARTNPVCFKDDHDMVWLIGGFGFDKNGQTGRMNDVWRWDGANWTWVKGSDTKNPTANHGEKGVTKTYNTIGGKAAATVFGTGNEYLIMGGKTYYSSGGAVSSNDIWKIETGTNLKMENGGANSMTLRELILSSTEQAGNALQDPGDYLKIDRAYGVWNEIAIDTPLVNPLASQFDQIWQFEKNDVNNNGGTLKLKIDLRSTINSDYSYYLLERNGSSGSFSIFNKMNYKIVGTKVVFTLDWSDITNGNQYSFGKSLEGAVYCLDFDGSDDYVEINSVASSLASSNATLEGWFVSENDNDALFAINTSSGTNKCMLYRNKIWDVTYNSAIPFSSAVSDSKWHHYALVIESGTAVEVYIDGALIQTFNSGSMVINADDKISIGQEFDGATPSNFLKGKADEVRIWNDKRTGLEIKEFMHRTLEGNEPNLVAYYRFDQATETYLPDVSQNNNTGVMNQFALTGTTSNWVESKAVVVGKDVAKAIVGPGMAVEFDGVDDIIETTLDVQPSAMAITTWEAWIYPKSLGVNKIQAILSTDDGSFDRSLVIDVNSSKLTVYTGTSGSGEWTPNYTLTVNKWTHVAMVYTPTNTLFYVNGIRFERGTAASGQSTSYDLSIGSNVYGHAFNGIVDEVRIWNDKRTQVEIQDNMYAALTGSESNLASYYTFDRAFTATLYDVVSTKHGALSNFFTNYSAWVSAAGREPYKTIKSGAHGTASNWKGGVAPSAATDKLAIFHDLDISNVGTYDRLHVSSNTTLSLGANINVTGDVVVNGTCSGSSKTVFNGTSQQRLAGSGTIGALEINNSSDVSLEGDLTINGALTLTDGDVKINDHTLTLTGTTSHGSSSSYLRINGDGQVKTTVGSDPVILPIGRNPYLPIIIDDGGDAEYTVSVANHVYLNPEAQTTALTSNTVTETWAIQASTAVNDVVVQVGWDVSEEASFDRTLSGLGYWEEGVSSAWNNSPTVSAATGGSPYFQTRTLDFTTNLFYFGVGGSGSPLPVELTYFNAQWLETGETAQLTWQTATEENNSHFEIERSFDGLAFEIIGRVAGQGTTFQNHDYDFLDKDLAEATNTIYYRLKQVDYNGQFEYSPIRTLNVEDESNPSKAFVIFPNPSSGEFIHTDQSDTYRVISTTGMVLKTSTQTTHIYVGDLESGSYIIENSQGSTKLHLRN